MNSVQSSFPDLCYICLDFTDFTGTNLDSISVDMPIDCLMERCERNAEVQELSLKFCYGLLEQDFVGLREVIVNVEWDGVEKNLSYSEEEREYDSDGNTIDDEDYEDYEPDYYN